MLDEYSDALILEGLREVDDLRPFRVDGEWGHYHVRLQAAVQQVTDQSCPLD